MDMKIKNKYSKAREITGYKTKERLLSYSSRLGEKIIKLCAIINKEKYIPQKIEYDDEISSLDFNEIFQLNEIYMVNFVRKSNYLEFTKGIIKIISDNSTANNIEIDSIRVAIKKMANFIGGDRYYHYLDSISPTDDNLSSIVETIRFEICNVTHDLFIVIAKLELNESKQNEFESILRLERIENTRIKNIGRIFKPIISREWRNPDHIRNEKYEDLVLEIKSVFNDYLCSYLPIELNYDEFPPISVNIYQTSYDINGKSLEPDSFIRNFYVTSNFFLNKTSFNSNQFMREDINEKPKSLKTHFSKVSNMFDTDNSINLIYECDNDAKSKVVTSGINLLPIILIMTYFEVVVYFEKKLVKDRKELYSTKRFKKFLNYKRHYRIRQDYWTCLLILKNMNFKKLNCENNNYFTESDLNYFYQRSREVLDLYSDTTDEYKRIAENTNFRSSFLISIISFLIAIIALGLQVYEIWSRLI